MDTDDFPPPPTESYQELLKQDTVYPVNIGHIQTIQKALYTNTTSQVISPGNTFTTQDFQDVLQQFPTITHDTFTYLVLHVDIIPTKVFPMTHQVLSVKTEKVHGITIDYDELTPTTIRPLLLTSTNQQGHQKLLFKNIKVFYPKLARSLKFQALYARKFLAPPEDIHLMTIINIVQ
jgi:hypothetical protein